MASEDGTPTFVPAPKLTDEDVQRIVETTARRVIRLCQRRGLFDDGAVDPYWEEQPLLAQIAAASVQGTVATGDSRGYAVTSFAHRSLPDDCASSMTTPWCSH